MAFIDVRKAHLMAKCEEKASRMRPLKLLKKIRARVQAIVVSCECGATECRAQRTDGIFVI